MSNPFPHRQILPRLVEFAAILGAKLENTSFGEDRRMRKELGVRDLSVDVLLVLTFVGCTATFAHGNIHQQASGTVTGVGLVRSRLFRA